ncbi:hypothetical protein HK104_001814 [Borealophlyctis nickersoniae]|nr:hypothetical protein HK104_001814 [Borealophlyctis nickersoniae]
MLATTLFAKSRCFLFFLAAFLSFTLVHAWTASEPPQHKPHTIDVDNVTKRHDYRLTFKQPYFTYAKDSKIPYFETVGSVVVSHDFVRLVPSVPELKGAIWAESANHHKEWQVAFSVLVSGRGYTGGAGFAFWYTKQRAELGPVMGSRDKWEGLGVIFDTADQAEGRYAPYNYGVENKGDVEWAHRRDYMHAGLGGCFRDYRGTTTPVWVRVTYVNETVKVDMDPLQHGHNFIECFTAPIKLPKGYYFGVSAATEAHFADDHDVLSFETYELNPPKPPKQVEHERHTMRPHEKEVSKGEEFKLSEEMKHKIETTEHAVHEAQQQEHVPETLNPQVISHMMENQFRIIEALNVLEHKMGEPGISHDPTNKAGSGSEHTVNALGDVVGRLQRLEEDMNSFRHAAHSQASEQLNRIQEIQRVLDSQHQIVGQVQQQQQQQASLPPPAGGAGGHWMLYLGAFGTGIGLAMAINAYRRRKEEQSKKFI